MNKRFCIRSENFRRQDQHSVAMRAFRSLENEMASILRENPQKVLPHRTIYRIVSLYENMIEYNRMIANRNYIRLYIFGSQVLHYVARRAFWSHLNDGDFIARLLLLLYNLEGQFVFLFSPDETGVCPYIDCCFNTNEVRFLDFFLYQAYRQKLIINGQRIADLVVFHRFKWLHPCEVAVDLQCPALLHVLLKYGALITEDSVTTTGLHALDTLCYQPLTLFILVLKIVKSIIEGLNNGRYEGQTSQCDAAVRCGCLMIRVCPQMKRALLYNSDINFSGYNSQEEAFRFVEEQGLLNLQYRFVNPLPLKHACRLKIRRLLHRNWQLPFGIDKLSLPKILKSYLDLKFD